MEHVWLVFETNTSAGFGMNTSAGNLETNNSAGFGRNTSDSVQNEYFGRVRNEYFGRVQD